MSGEARVSFLREYRMNKMSLGPDIRDLVENRVDGANYYTHQEST